MDGLWILWTARIMAADMTPSRASWRRARSPHTPQPRPGPGRPSALPRAAAAALAAVLALSGCAAVRDLAAGAFDRPTLTFESWAARDLDLDGVTILLRYRVDNPNGFGLDLAELGYALEVEGRPIASGDLPAGLQLRARAASPLDVPVRLRWREVPGLARVLVSQRDVAYRVSGRAGVRSPIGVLTLPFEHAARVALPRVPSVRLEGVALREASFSQVSLDLKLRVGNANAFPLPVGALTYGLRVGDREVVSGASHPLVAVPAGGDAVVSIPVRISTAQAAGSVRELTRGAEVRLRGVAGFGGLDVPLDASSKAR